MSDNDTLTTEKLLAVAANMVPSPEMPRWADLTWAQRNLVEREIAATADPFVRDVMRRNFYRCPEGCDCAAQRGEGRE